MKEQGNPIEDSNLKEQGKLIEKSKGRLDEYENYPYGLISQDDHVPDESEIRKQKRGDSTVVPNKREVPNAVKTFHNSCNSLYDEDFESHDFEQVYGRSRRELTLAAQAVIGMALSKPCKPQGAF